MLNYACALCAIDINPYLVCRTDSTVTANRVCCFRKLKTYCTTGSRFFLLRRSYLKNTIFFNDWKQNIEKFRNKIIELLLSPEKTTTHLIEAQLVFQDFCASYFDCVFLKKFSCFQSRFLVGWQHPVGIDLMVKGRRG